MNEETSLLLSLCLEAAVEGTLFFKVRPPEEYQVKLPSGELKTINEPAKASLFAKVPGNVAVEVHTVILENYADEEHDIITFEGPLSGGPLGRSGGAGEGNAH